MRVLLFLPTLAGGGAERSMLTVAGALQERGHEVDLLTALPGGDLAVPPTVTHRNLGVAHARSAVPALVRHLRATRPDVALTALDHGNAAVVAAARLGLTRVPVVVSYRADVGAAAASGRGRQKLRPLAASLVMRGADEVIAVSHGVADGLRRIAPWVDDRLTVAYNPTVGQRLLDLAGEPLDDPWIDAHDGPVLLAAGRLTPQKGYDRLLTAFALVRREEPAAALVIIGEGPLRAELEEQARALGVADAVHLPGFAANSYPYMRRCDAFVLSSRWEGLANVLVEAGALGAPLVATDCPAGPRELLTGRPNTELVELDDVPALAKAMATALGRGRTPDAPAVWHDHTVDASVDVYEAVLRRAAGRRART